ncbi:hypothetical protein HDV05_000256 [Chytridiales sp. JEL 0842]|nr:hypothetical protein HDV05_000256 [Chytridiales sp. JEL 0842]
MFLLKTIGSIVWGKADNSLVQIPEGELYKINPPGSKVAKTLLFKDCSATVKRTNVPHNYQIVITRIFDEGEDEDDLDAETEFMFLIDEVLRFKRTGGKMGTSGNQPWCFSWLDPLDDSKSTGYEFIPNSSNTTETTVATFEMVVYQSMYERRSGKDHTEATDEEMEAYINFVKASSNNNKKAVASVASPSASSTGSPASVYGSPAASTPKKGPIASIRAEDVTPHQSPVPMSTSQTPENRAASAAGPSSYLNHVTPSGESLVKVPAELYLYDHRVGQFLRMRDQVDAEIVNTAPFQFTLLVSENGQPYISQPLETQMNAQFNRENRAFVWLWREETAENVCYPWSLRFFNDQDEEKFRSAFGASMYEANNAEKFGKVAAGDKEYLVSAYDEDVEMMDAEASESERDSEDEKSESDDEDQEEDEAEHESMVPKQKEKISQLTVGHKDRSFFVRGNTIGVLKYTDDDGLEYSTDIKNVSTLDKKTFTPRKVMLHDQDTSMLLMNPDSEHSVFRMDLNVGKVVEEWKVHDILTVEDIVPDNKRAPLTPNKTVVGINHNSIFRIDPRLSGMKMVESESKTYATKSNFSCATTTGSGELAVASKKGDIRLYNKLNIKAKTHLPGLGDPIIGIDTTENGKWIISTCNNYLLLTCTEAKDPAKGTFSGFQKSLGDKKPIPRRLQLRPEHVAFMGGKVNFTPARFNTIEGSNGEEKSIVTSTGPYVITWNFRRVKQGRLFDYTIKEYNDNIVADNFKFGQDRSIVVALPDDVQTVSKSKLQTPTKMLKSRSSIVNSPY